MKSMKSLIKNIANTQYGIMFRNFIGFKPVILSIKNIKESSSVSDAFCWRTDNDFKTTFNFVDILKLYYNIENSYVEIVFYSKSNKLLKILNLQYLDLSNELVIDNKLLNGVNDYGVFYIFHRFDKDIPNKVIISNRCYLGFSVNNNLNSFVHGNSYAKYQNIMGGSQGSDIINTNLLMNQIYRIQNCFENISKSELFFANPTSNKIQFSVNGNNYILDVGCSKIVDVSSENEITIISNCCFLRPIVFNYKDKYLDVYHA